MDQPVSLAAAFLAGLLSFLSPCVLPLVPGYLSFMSGVNLSLYKQAKLPAGLARRVALLSAAFVLGFSTVFIALGAAATLVVGAFFQDHKRMLGFIGGIVIVILGVHMTGLFRIRWLLQERRAEIKTRPLGLFGAYAVGLAFAFGWTPCIGPILGAILGYASLRETVGEGVLLLASYSAGLGVPFLLSALAIHAFFTAFSRLRGSLRAIEIISGSLLVLVGLLLVTDRIAVLARLLSRLFPSLLAIG
ncbi:MAG: cytochrome c biogenesis protein CcdA [Vicinamibacteria bacterium]|nr:cytochrome c biogenesis protein CcdA [Vicinamibacteria bacterium]